VQRALFGYGLVNALLYIALLVAVPQHDLTHIPLAKEVKI
jgi:hypothetical protein